MKCNACHTRDSRFKGKFTFSQTKSNVPNSQPRFGITMEAEGGYCLDCKVRMQRMLAESNFKEVIGADMRQMVAIMFEVRGLGQVAWDETAVEFVDETPDAAPNLSLDKLKSN